MIPASSRGRQAKPSNIENNRFDASGGESSNE